MGEWKGKEVLRKFFMSVNLFNAPNGVGRNLERTPALHIGQKLDRGIGLKSDGRAASSP